MNTDDTPKTGIAAAQQAHAELHSTLNQLAYKLDYPSRIDAAVSRGKARVRATRRSNPALFFAVAGAASVVVGLATAAVVSAVIKSL